MTEDDLLASEAASIAGLSVPRLRELSDSGEIACTRLGRNQVRTFKRADLEALRDRRTASRADRVARAAAKSRTRASAESSK